ncbi:MAG: PDZ domain-containing protein [Bacteroidota bacterium]
MKRFLFLFTLLIFCSLKLNATDPVNTRFMHQPAISQENIAFIYANDLWVANHDGSNPIRLTIDEGVESNPHFSPDGKTIAFSAQYDGNTDVFTIPVTGGVPKRLTYHPGWDLVRGFTPSGKVVFSTQRTIHTSRYSQFFTIDTSGGFPVQVKIPHGNRAAYSPDGKFIAYTPGREVFWQWKGYRGGTMSRIWIFSMADNSVVEIPKPAEGSNDTYPIWINNTVYFTSDREGEFNLYSYDTNSKSVKKLTDHNDFPVLSVSGAGNKIVYEQAGLLHMYDINNGASETLKIGIATDLLELRPRYASGAKYARSAAISPSGSRAVIDFRGDIITVPEENGDPRNLTQTPGAHEKYPAWSADGKSVAYFSDQSGEYQLVIENADGSGSGKKYDINGSGFYAYTRWSPDSKHIAFVDNSRSLYLFDVSNGTLKKVDSDEMYFPGVFRDSFGDWSSDSKWITYTKIIESNYEKVYLYSIENQKSYPVSDGLSNASSPCFDESGKYLYFMASTDAGPVVNWFAQSNQDMELTNHIYLATLQTDLLSPFAKKSDEESDKKETKENAKEGAAPVINPENIESRIIDVPIPAGSYASLKSGKAGKLYFIDTESDKLNSYDINEQKKEELLSVDGYQITADNEKMLYYGSGKWAITKLGSSDAGKSLNLNAVQVKIDPKEEWPNMFYEAWRVNRDYFYDPGFHGADWEAMKKKYEVFLPHLSCRRDLNALIQWMCSELRVGHHRLTNGGDFLNSGKRIPGGLLGADYEIKNNRYRFKKIYGGLNWTPDLVSPLTEPGINAKAGDYLLEVDGINLTSDMNLFSLFEHKSGRIVELKIGPNANGSKSRTVKVTPISNEAALRNRDWVEGNLKKVHDATNGKVAYVHVPNTTVAGHEYFKRYFFPQVNKQAIIVDERYNRGGQIADYYIDILLRPYQSYWNFRHGKDLKTPSASIQGPKVLLIDENAGSGGDMLPWMFRKFNVGTMVGKTTWGGLVGILGFPEFIDGGSVTAPNVAIWTKDGYIVENEGVAPDVEVEQWPKDLIEGRDPQLEKAIEIVMQQLADNPPVKPTRPPYPVKTKN